MRQLVVGFAFEELGALECGSGYIVGNRASAAVSRKTGYVENGRRLNVQHTTAGKVGVDEQRALVTPTSTSSGNLRPFDGGGAFDDFA
jgi:RimJ/RimL family protein N-acetyltransferase